MAHDNAHERFLQMLHKTVYVFDRYADRLLADNRKGTFSQLLILTAIARCKAASQQKLAEFLNLTPAAVSRQIDALVTAGFIIREDDPHNRRTHVIRLTPAGEKKYTAMKTALLNTFKEKIDAVDQLELERASKTLECVLAALDPECAAHKTSEQKH
jgi:MarR family transcriptional regulator for hemolysin